jgi:SAM-dependent methyltransferase
MDAEAMNFDRQFDFLWSVESISHYQDRPGFFASAAKLLRPNGTFALTDWFKKDHLTPAQSREFIEPIETGMFLELQTMDDYAQFLASNGLQITHREVLNKNCARTWDLSLEIIKDKKFWALAAKLGPHFVAYLKAFHAMRAGFASSNFVYGLFVASVVPKANHVQSCKRLTLFSAVPPSRRNKINGDFALFGPECKIFVAGTTRRLISASLRITLSFCIPEECP